MSRKTTKAPRSHARRVSRISDSKVRDSKVRYAVVGLGYISQSAVLPAFRHARKNSALTALVSDDPRKLEELAARYRVPRVYDYAGYADCLASGEIDAVYIALPNAMHREYAVAAAKAGKHVLCEKPLAVTVRDCEEMIRAAADNRVRLMTAYRLHFEKANLKAVETVRSGKIGEPRFFQSVFSMQVEEGNIRLSPTDQGGGPIYDIGIYCINAARYLFRSEPEEVYAYAASSGEKRFQQSPEMMTCVMRFPRQRLASFTCSFGAADTGWYQVAGTQGELRMEPAYELAEPITQRVTVRGKTVQTRFPKRDQFAPELIYFSDCVLRNKDPEPSGKEGLADVRVIRALLQSADSGRSVTLGDFERTRRPSMAMEMRRPPVPRARLIHVESPSGD